ncbi:MAG: biotin transporter BioY [Abditibacteriota bacterium]|nr:biotin transporter BioY [Abditibacteriota bacterium]
MVFKAAARCVAGALFTYLLSRLRFETGAPVPVTGQVFSLVLLSLLWGPWISAGASLLYLGAGAAGTDVFAARHALAGPGAGYLVSFPFAACLMGLAFRKSRKTLTALTASAVPGLLAVYLGGACGLLLKEGPGTALLWSAAPYVCWDMVKIILAVMLYLYIRSRDETGE